MARAHRMTPKRKAALRKAQLASAKKRRGIGGHLSRNRKRYIVGAAAIGTAVLASRTSVSVKRGPNTNRITGQRLGNGPRSVTRRGAVIGYGANKVTVGVAFKGFGIRKSNVHGTGTRSRVDRDQIPLYNSKTSKSWPHVGAPQSRRTNAKLREKGMLG